MKNISCYLFFQNLAHSLIGAASQYFLLPFRLVLIGRCCVGVTPSLTCHPDVILAGGRINGGMGKFITEQAVKWLIATDQLKNGRGLHSGMVCLRLPHGFTGG